jgi:phosphonate degradation associated HDIG domain protein
MRPSTEQTVEEIFTLLTDSGSEQYFGEQVTKLEHALQCAHHAQAAGADEELVLAALLHDIGHLLEDDAAEKHPEVGVINHDSLGGAWLRNRGFSERCAALVENHVNAKRYLTATNPQYFSRLSPASVETLEHQGGPMRPEEVEAFARSPYLKDFLRLRSWDEMAKDPHWQGPGIESFRPLLEKHLTR